MPKKFIPPPKVTTREIVNGRIYACDANGRPCFDLDNPERVVLTQDFRAYAPELHRGALGWTIPTDSDGYTFARIAFDAGPRLRLRNFTVDRVPAETAEAVAAQIIAENRNTRFDADQVVAARHYQAFLASYADTLSLASTSFDGTGDQEVYAFTYPSLVEIATLKGEAVYPVKIGYTKSGYCKRSRSFGSRIALPKNIEPRLTGSMKLLTTVSISSAWKSNSGRSAIPRLLQNLMWCRSRTTGPKQFCSRPIGFRQASCQRQRGFTSNSGVTSATLSRNDRASSTNPSRQRETGCHFPSVDRLSG
jgi:hypothetical protein